MQIIDDRITRIRAELTIQVPIAGFARAFAQSRDRITFAKQRRHRARSRSLFGNYRPQRRDRLVGQP